MEGCLLVSAFPELSIWSAGSTDTSGRGLLASNTLLLSNSDGIRSSSTTMVVSGVIPQIHFHIFLEKNFTGIPSYILLPSMFLQVQFRGEGSL